ncbi:piriformospora indica-insensitive protein 2 [Lactuca sativa]|uniref:piriformospora indica-insensitive protein 2 n=1 Tax=Lactuca sativa TaxID=4236 RepID=UPI000CB7559D|nr:piriformospora indica-insensitive protein 2 [Lactuca sativa]
MAISSSPTYAITFFISLLIIRISGVNSQPFLNSVEQESVYRVLEALNSDIPWRSLFPDDLCSSAPHGVVCGYSIMPTATNPGTVNILELSFGYVSDHNPNPPCGPNSTLQDPFIFSAFPYLRKLFFYNCFTQQPVSLQAFSHVGSSLEELVFIENASLFGSLTESIGNMTSLRRLVITGTNVSGDIPVGFGTLQNLEEATLSRNRFTGTLPENVSNLKKLRILDLSQNGFEGNIPAAIGELQNLIKLDLSLNLFSGNFPVSMKGLKNIELLDLSYNRFTNFGIPIFLSEMSKLKEVYLSGNELGGLIPDIWKNLRGIIAIGFSGVGLVGNIPSSIGVFLGNLTYLALDNNKLTGRVPLELERLTMVNELNLKNNSLSGKLPFSDKFVSRVGNKLRVQGNPELCVDGGVIRSFHKSSGVLGQLKVCNSNSNRVANTRSDILHVSSSSFMGHQVSYLVIVFLLFLIM